MKAQTIRKVGRYGGPLVAFAVLLLPEAPGLDPVGQRTAAVTLWMAVWWMTEAVAIPVTALLPLAAFPLLGILSAANASTPYANEIIFLFLGGFLLAAAMEESGLHRRIALAILARVGSSPEGLVLGFMLATALLSMWISNTATTAMMFPIGVAVAELFRRGGPKVGFRFGVTLMLGIAYAASIGGVATLIGTPPNAILAAAASELLGVEIGFGEWMLVGLPTTAIMLPLGWLLLVRVLHPPGRLEGDAAAVIDAERAALGPVRPAERRVAAVFGATALAWLLRAPKVVGEITIPGLATFAPELRDSSIAMAAALVLFVLPTGDGSGTRLLEWPRARRIPWGVLVLFGGGLSLARAMDESGLSGWVGSGVAHLGALPLPVILAAIAVLFVLLTEVTSNAATSTMAMPLLVGAAGAMTLPALPLMVSAALAASMAFMLPVATPPNAIVFGSDYLEIRDMMRAGVWMNLLAVVVVTGIVTLLFPLVFGV
ncbi:MAG: DASS family sodium-coupled anion symporter [Longimicrobiales bacterium]|nr:DASS family sodium-coupled anion symporter [Longimicrobiales bacterium]